MRRGQIEPRHAFGEAQQRAATTRDGTVSDYRLDQFHLVTVLELTADRVQRRPRKLTSISGEPDREHLQPQSVSCPSNCRISKSGEESIPFTNGWGVENLMRQHGEVSTSTSTPADAASSGIAVPAASTVADP